MPCFMPCCVILSCSVSVAPTWTYSPLFVTHPVFQVLINHLSVNPFTVSLRKSDISSLFTATPFWHISRSVMSNSLQPQGLQHQASLSITNSWSLLKLMSIELVMPSNHLILCHPLLFPPSIFPSIRVFSNESVLRIRWPKYWSFSSSISPSNEYPGWFTSRLTGFISFQSKGLPQPYQHISCSVLFQQTLLGIVWNTFILTLCS